ncbi:MAG: NifB/NifX family molybdenum-iron cluster-binding protein [Clostridiaceae bacterium]|nr:NifB/NifX family molybdenum-iron cluster-binding protein [Clostridiaceae bacterium]
MRIAIPYENETGNIFQHFGQTQRFKTYDIENGKVTIATVINTNGSGHGALADILKKCEVDTLICGGIGVGAKRALSEAGIKLYGGATGNADQAISSLINGTLSYDSEIECVHHGEHHDCTCGDHEDQKHDCSGQNHENN